MLATLAGLSYFADHREEMLTPFAVLSIIAPQRTHFKFLITSPQILLAVLADYFIYPTTGRT